MPGAMTMLADHPARQLLDFSQKLDINLLDNVVNSMYHDIGSQVRAAPFLVTGPQLPAQTAVSVLRLKTSRFVRRYLVFD